MIRHMIKSTLVLLMLISSSAFANNPISSQTKTTKMTDHDSKWNLIFGGQLGYGVLSTENIAGFSRKDGNLYGGIFIGLDYHLIKKMSVGIEYGNNYGYDLLEFDSNCCSNTVKMKHTVTVPLLLTLKYWTSFGLNFFAKGGAAYVHQADDASGPDDGTVNLSKDALKTALAGGIGYQIDRWNFFIQYMYIFGDENAVVEYNKSSSLPVQSITGGVSYMLPL